MIHKTQIKSRFKFGDIVVFCGIKCRVNGFKFTAELTMLIDTTLDDTEPKPYERSYVALICKVCEGEKIPSSWNEDGTVYPLDRIGDVELFTPTKTSYSISDIKRLTSENAPFFFAAKTLKFFGQTVKGFKLKKQEDGRIKISQPITDNGMKRGETIRFFNPITNTLDHK